MPATLFVSPLSPFARKAMIINRLAELGVVEVEPVRDAATGYNAALNPLGKVPSLQLSDGRVIVDSPVICEWLDQQGHAWLTASADLIAARSLHALGDGLATAAYDYRYETVRPAHMHWKSMIERKTEAMRHTALWLEARVADLDGPIAGASWGGLAVATALDYVDFRAGHVGWRDIAPNLAAWHAGLQAHAVWADTNAYGDPAP